jgi:PIN domain nuclease of toxin-antitoxin system
MTCNGPVMMIICDTHIPILYQDAPSRLSAALRQTFAQHIGSGRLALADISLWEIAMLFDRGRLNSQAVTTPKAYIDDLITGYGLKVLPITVEIAVIAQGAQFVHGDPADRLIAATVIQHKALLLSKDEKLRGLPGLETLW